MSAPGGARRQDRAGYGAGSSGAARAPGWPDAPGTRAAHGHGRCTGGGAMGSEVFSGSLFEDLLVEHQVGDCQPQPRVFLLKLLETPKLIVAHPAVLRAPAIERDLADPESPDRIRHRQALAVKHLRRRRPPLTGSSSMLLSFSMVASIEKLTSCSSRSRESQIRSSTGRGGGACSHGKRSSRLLARRR